MPKNGEIFVETAFLNVRKRPRLNGTCLNFLIRKALFSVNDPLERSLKRLYGFDLGANSASFDGLRSEIRPAGVIVVIGWARSEVSWGLSRGVH